jgi:Ca2+-dependent lipid-binding protein
VPLCTFADPYVKIYLLFNNQRIAKKKTHVKKRTLNPVFNESFVFEIPQGAEGLDSVSLDFMLLDWDRVTKNEVRYLHLLQRKIFSVVAKIRKIHTTVHIGNFFY